MIKKLQKAQNIKGPKFIHIYAPCPTGWRMAPDKTVEIAKMATACGVFPLFEVENGVYTITRKLNELKPVKPYLAMQGRFRHLPEEEIESMQNEITKKWNRLLKLEEFTKEIAEMEESE